MRVRRNIILEMNADSKSAREAVSAAKRVIVKVGTSLLTGNTTTLNERFVARLCQAVSELWKQGREAGIVTSGAIGAGCGLLGYDQRPTSLAERQACAAVGQVELMKVYAQAFKRLKPPRAVGQLLLTRDTLTSRRRYLYSRNTLMQLFQRGAVPVVNENDTISVEEIRFGDNDTLSALVAGISESDLLVMLTDVAGLMDTDPRANPNAKLISTVDALTPEIESLALPTGTFLAPVEWSANCRRHGSRCRRVLAASWSMAIARRFCWMYWRENRSAHISSRAKFASARANIGWRSPRIRRVKSLSIPARNWRYARAEKVCCRRESVDVLGEFKPGDMVSLTCENREFARGLANFSSKETHMIRGKKSEELKVLLGRATSPETVHRDNLVILA